MTRTLNYAYTAGCSSLDPHNPVAGNDALFMRPAYDRLVSIRRSATGGFELTPQLATGWRLAEGNRSLEFDLRDDVRFHDGSPFDAQVVEANLARAMGPHSVVAGAFDNVASVEVLGRHRMRLALHEPEPGLIWALAVGTAGMMISAAAIEAGRAGDGVGSGPFVVRSVTRDRTVEYERWSDHWDPEAGLVDELTITTLPDIDGRLEGTRDGTFQIGHLYPPAAASSRSLTSSGFAWHRVLSPVIYALLMNNAVAPFDDVRVRRAIHMAIDRTHLSVDILDGLSPPTYQVFVPGVVGHDPALDVDPYDLETARKLVDEAGATGAALRFIQHLASPSVPMGEFIRGSLAEIGLSVELNAFSNTEALPAFRAGGYHGDLGSILGRPEPSQTLIGSILGRDNPGTVPQDLSQMAQSARSLPLASARREAAYRAISAALVERPVHIPLAQFSSVYLCRPEVRGFERLLDIALTDFRGITVQPR